MFVHRSRLLTQSALATVALLGAACDDPVAQTDLRPEGDPEVLTVMVFNDNDPTSLIFETATFCKQGDVKRPGQVAVGLTFTPIQVCDADLDQPAGFRDGDNNFMAATVADANPTAWYARFQFDELIDPDVEELISITTDHDGDPATPEIDTGTFRGSLAATQPAILTCTPVGGTAVAVPYDGYYSPSGNSVTWPVGPSLVIQPLDPSTVATSSTCTVELKDSVVDKTGNPVPADQRGTGGTYTFDIAALSQDLFDPEPSDPGMEPAIAIDAPVVVGFNAPVDPTTLAAATEVTVKEGAVDVVDCAMVEAAGTAKAAGEIAIAGAPGNTLEITTTGGWVAGRMYAVTFSPDNEVADLAGGTGAITATTICFVAE
jgi:hypothetical protein